MITAWIVNYNSRRHVSGCIASLPEEVTKVIVLDNGTRPSEMEQLSKIDDPRLTVLRNENNLGFGGGMNFIAQAEPPEADDIIWLLNPDTEVISSDLGPIVAAVSKGRCIASPVVLSGPSHNYRVWFAGGELDFRTGQTRHHGFGNQVDDTAILREISFVSGAAPMLSGATWLTLGGFDASLFLYWEDVDWSLRAKAAGIDIAVVPSVLVWHKEGGSDESPGTDKSLNFYYYMARNRLIVLRRLGRPAFNVRARRWFETLRMVAVPLRHDVTSRIPKALAVLAGIRDGIAGRTGAR